MFAVISKDAGGAELAIRFALIQKEDLSLALSGPAIEIFKKKLNKVKIISRAEAIRQSDWVLCSTGTSGNFEKDGLILAKKNKKKVISILDHWVGYRSRFIKKQKLFLPNEIWVTDKYALKILKKENFSTKIVFKNNLYFDEFRIKNRLFKNKKNKPIGKNVIFLSEKVNPKFNKNYNNDQCIKYFFNNLPYLKIKIQQITIRFHPREKIRKLKWLTDFPTKILISKNKHVFDDILQNDIIVGINTVALVLGLIAKKKVISCIPTKKDKCVLPHKKILDFKKIIYIQKKLNSI